MSEIWRRIGSGAAASSLVLIYLAVLQLISLPVLTHAWGAKGYGTWIMLTTIPSFLALADFGFAQAATSDMAMRIARGDRGCALAIFQSIWMFVCLVSVVAVALAALVFLTPLPYATVLFLLVAYTAVGQCSRIVLAGFRASGHYARGTLTYDTLVFAEGLSVLGIALLGGGHTASAFALLALRLAITGVLYASLRRTVPWLGLGVAHATPTELRRLAKPALAAMAIPAALALNLQGMVLVVGAVISPVAAATFAAVRTISRLGIQIVGTLNRASMPEMSAAYATGRANAANKILLANAASVLLLIVPGAVFFAIFGGEIVDLWSHGVIRPESSFVALMAVGIVTHSIWYYASNLLMATNSHGSLAAIALPSCALAVAVAIPAANALGLLGVAATLIVLDLVCLLPVLSALRALRSQTPSSIQPYHNKHSLLPMRSETQDAL